MLPARFQMAIEQFDGPGLLHTRVELDRRLDPLVTQKPADNFMTARIFLKIEEADEGAERVPRHADAERLPSRGCDLL